eukprot:TRINITY_DN12528_c0_g2_i6.p1 TRINITY_DN12528_c0_g2~~TRINITY_DN12528_c0_g2_i6.p1  ORF type:complete len:181 (+),score=25.55 TRINITY_DN12528_c0_g2_i6:348-890(+)
METFGKEQLKDGVLDIAGGQGKLSLELQLRYGYFIIPALSDRAKYTMYHCRPKRNDAIQKTNTHFRTKKRATTNHDITYPKSISCLVSNTEYFGFFISNYINFFFQLIYFEDDFLEDPQNLEIFNSVYLIAGMHPDQATERIVKFGLKYRKNFAVLPCCVFPKMYICALFLPSFFLCFLL